MYKSNKTRKFSIYHQKPKKRSKHPVAGTLGVSTGATLAAQAVGYSALNKINAYKLTTQDRSSLASLKRYGRKEHKGLVIDSSNRYGPQMPAGAMPSSKTSKMGRTLSRALPDKPTIILNKNMSPEVLSHELGHQEQWKKRPKSYRRLLGSRAITGLGLLPSMGLTHLASKKPFKSEKANKRLRFAATGAAGVTALGAANMFATEVGATARGLRMMKKLKRKINPRQLPLLAAGGIGQGIAAAAPAAGAYYYRRKKLGKVKISRKKR